MAGVAEPALSTPSYAQNYCLIQTGLLPLAQVRSPSQKDQGHGGARHVEL